MHFLKFVSLQLEPRTSKPHFNMFKALFNRRETVRLIFDVNIIKSLEPIIFKNWKLSFGVFF